MIALVSERQRFGEPLGPVVDTARPDGIDVPPIILRLWIHLRVAINF
jgi:hypothetical protein